MFESSLEGIISMVTSPESPDPFDLVFLILLWLLWLLLLLVVVVVLPTGASCDQESHLKRVKSCPRVHLVPADWPASRERPHSMPLLLTHSLGPFPAPSLRHPITP